MKKHTPAPWRCVPKLGGGYTVLAHQGPIEVCPAHVSGLADANLIAAAPELLAALKALYDRANRGRSETECQTLAELDAAGMAIAKAEHI